MPGWVDYYQRASDWLMTDQTQGGELANWTINEDPLMNPYLWYQVGKVAYDWWGSDSETSSGDPMEVDPSHKERTKRTLHNKFGTGLLSEIGKLMHLRPAKRVRGASGAGGRSIKKTSRSKILFGWKRKSFKNRYKNRYKNGRIRRVKVIKK